MSAIEFFISLIGFVSGCIGQFVTYIFQVPSFFYTFCVVFGLGSFAIVYRIFKGVFL